MGDEARATGTALASRLEALLGSGRVSAEPRDSIQGVVAPLEVRPADESQLSEIIRLASSDGLGVCVTGGGTKLGWGNRPRRLDLLISTRDLRSLPGVDVDNLSVAAGAGLPIGEARAKAQEVGRLLPLDPRRSSEATIGGVTATADQGARGATYGGIRDVVLGLRAVLADGSRVKFGGRTMKNVSGYDMTKLLVGSFGVLGVITEVTFRLLPRPEKQSLIVLPLSSMEEAKAIAAEILASYLQPLALEVISARFARLAGVAGGAAVVATNGAAAVSGSARPLATDPTSEGGLLMVAAFAGHPAAVSRSINEVGGRFGSSSRRTFEDTEADSFLERLADVETALPEVAAGAAPRTATARAAATEAASYLGARACLPLSDVWEVAKSAESRAQAMELPLAYRIGAARGTLDLYISALDAADPGPRLTAFATAVRQEARSQGGQLTVMNGVQLLAPDFDAWGDLGAPARLMGELKERFDPAAVLNPGRFVGGI